LARPTTKGITYFPVDVNFDGKIKLFIADEGAEGIGILVTIWQLIYQNEGYFIENNDDLVKLIRLNTMSDLEIIRRVIQSLLARNVFSKTKENKYKILTSKGIQSRYFDAAKQKKTVNVHENYLCMGVIRRDNWVSMHGNATNVNVKVNVKVKVDTNESKLSLLQNLWNERIKLSKSGLRNVIQNSKDRKSKERLRLKSRGEESWKIVFDKINSSGFCCGENDQQWKASYDWIMANDTNAIKVLEGKYDGSQAAPGKEHVNTAELVKKRAEELKAGK
jgi:hypothetical protein